MNKKTYILKCRKTGREWKSFTKGGEFLKDDTVYEIRWELKGLKNYIKGWIGILRKIPHTFTYQKES